MNIMNQRLLEWNPFKELDRFRDRLSTALSETGNGNGQADFSSDLLDLKTTDWQPAVDVSEDDKEYLITADLPEVKKEEVEVGIENGVISISGERKSEVEQKDEKKKFHRIERSYGRYVRSFRLPDDVDADKIDAEFESGVLRVHLPKGDDHTRTKIKIS